MEETETKRKFLEIVKEFGLQHKSVNSYEYTLPNAKPTDFLIFYNEEKDIIYCAKKLRSDYKDYINNYCDWTFGFTGIVYYKTNSARQRVIKILKQYKQHLNKIKKLEMEKDFA